MILSIAVLITCHNRRDKTLACLETLFANYLPDGVSLHVILVDDDSTDGTREAISLRFPLVEIIQGNGELYWNRGMHLAFRHALKKNFDAYLWLNDDTILKGNAIAELVSTLPSDDMYIVVGAVSDPVNGQNSYGGARFVDPIFRPFLCTAMIPNGHSQDVDVFNGNVVMIPNSVARVVGNLDPIFEHSMGDTDYSMRARALGVRILLTPHYIAHCSRNSPVGTYLDTTLCLVDRLRLTFSRKGRPWRSWFTMCRRHGGRLWPIHFVWGYIKIVIGRENCVSWKKIMKH